MSHSRPLPDALLHLCSTHRNARWRRAEAPRRSDFAPRLVPRSVSALRRDTRGNVSLEFLMVMLFFSLPLALVLKELGPDAVALFEGRRVWLALPRP